MTDLIRPLDVERLRHEWKTAQPFPHIKIESFLQDDFAREVVASYPSFEGARQVGHEFSFVNEMGKVQVTDSTRFPEPVARLNALLASSDFLDQLETITGIPKLIADPKLAGGGMHVTGPSGRLDVHVDFNFDEERQWHRRMNLLLYLNPEWPDAWGGGVELWDRKVKRRYHRFAPLLNRVVVFETSHISYHGVEPVTCPPSKARRSFATYYYTKEAPRDWDGRKHSTIFRARPDERFRGLVLMPAERVAREAKRRVRRVVDFAARLRGS
ncbi:MAG: 2OG-Fe(II) oxygenase [Sandaracinus sp.]|nr:2OG-Fe(II) oxygenase [Sandaracinus sp.]MCB9634243.1 2OG-Fe(II) oxygenase [Sandaracinus sp.]